jgi:hypothetical protein
MSIFSRLFQKEEGDGGEGAPTMAMGSEVSALPPSLPPSAFRTPEEPAPVRKVEHVPVRRPMLPAPTQRRSSVPRRISPGARPAPPPIPRQAFPGAIPEQPVPVDAGPADSGAIDAALETLFPTPAAPLAPPPPLDATTAMDRAAVRATFEDLAVAHVRPLRSMMIELRWSEAALEWLALARPLLTSLRQMADQVELVPLCRAIDGFEAALDEVAGASGLSEEMRERLLAGYQPLVEALPQAFALDGERDRREPIIVQALLRQVAGLEPLYIQRLYSVGLGRLETLGRAGADEIAVVADIPAEVAAAVVSKVKELARTDANLVESAAAREGLHELVQELIRRHGAYEQAAEGWSPESLAAKRTHRREREQAFLQIKVVLARAGEVDLLLRLETLPFAARIDGLDGYLREAARAALQA